MLIYSHEHNTDLWTVQHDPVKNPTMPKTSFFEIVDNHGKHVMGGFYSRQEAEQYIKQRAEYNKSHA